MRFVFLLVALIPTIVLAAPSAPSPSVIAQNSELFQWFLGLCILLIGFFLNRTLNTIENNNKQQWKSIGALDKRLSHLEGAHAVNHNGGRRRYDPNDRPEED